MALSTERTHFEEALLALLQGLGISEIISTSRLAIINYVKAKLDELVPEGEGVIYSLSAAPNVSNPLDLLIDAHLDECTKDIILSAPLSVLAPTLANVGGVVMETGTGYVRLPDNFQRLSSFKMVDWKREVQIPTVTTDFRYRLQSNIYLRGTINKPVAVLNWKQITTGGLSTVTINTGGTGFATGANVLTVVQDGGTLGTINATASAGGVITALGSVATAGSGYSIATGLKVTGGTGTGCKINITAVSTPVYANKRILEYYSVTTHVVDKLLYIPESVAEDFVVVNPNLLDSLAWQCAGKIMQITGMLKESEIAQARVNQSYNNL